MVERVVRERGKKVAGAKLERRDGGKKVIHALPKNQMFDIFGYIDHRHIVTLIVK